MKKIGKSWFHPIVSWVAVGLFFSVVMIGNVLVALSILIFLIIRHPRTFPQKIRTMLNDWDSRVD